MTDIKSTPQYVVWMEQPVLDDFGINHTMDSDDLTLFIDADDRMELLCSSGKVCDVYRVTRRDLESAVEQYDLCWEPRETEE